MKQKDKTTVQKEKMMWWGGGTEAANGRRNKKERSEPQLARYTHEFWTMNRDNVGALVHSVSMKGNHR